MFAISFRPQTPALYAGEPLLLQLVKEEARKQGQEHARINRCGSPLATWNGFMTTVSAERDFPPEQRVWDWIISASATVPTVPLSLEDVNTRPLKEASLWPDSTAIRRIS